MKSIYKVTGRRVEGVGFRVQLPLCAFTIHRKRQKPTETLIANLALRILTSCMWRNTVARIHIFLLLLLSARMMALPANGDSHAPDMQYAMQSKSSSDIYCLACHERLLLSAYFELTFGLRVCRVVGPAAR